MGLKVQDCLALNYWRVQSMLVVFLDNNILKFEDKNSKTLYNIESKEAFESARQECCRVLNFSEERIYFGSMQHSCQNIGKVKMQIFLKILSDNGIDIGKCNKRTIKKESK